LTAWNIVTKKALASSATPKTLYFNDRKNLTKALI
jgi:hypothetical protein